ncbi:MAG: molybdopterin-dependent oxidoreductase [Chloroflexi bacterium]|nr:molybdopterin-dependent oxidoreductase [Chloroflexota bacterium]
METEQTRKAVCEFCHCRCRVVIHSQDGKLVKIEEDRSYPAVDAIFPPTKACLRLRGAAEFMYHKDRVNFPLKRVGERGEGKWQVVPWKEALDDVAASLAKTKEQHGAESIAVTLGTGRTREQFITRFFDLLGTPNWVGQGNICFTPSVETDTAMFGWPVRAGQIKAVGGDAPTRESTRCILVIGLEPSQSQWRVWKTIRSARENGIKLIVMDPRKTATAELADIWLQLRPGTDMAVLMAMINIVIQQGLYDREFVEKYCHGFDKVAERVRPYTPEKVAEMSWLSADAIRAAAVMFAANRPGVTVSGMGIEHQQDAIATLQAKNILTAIVGNIDREGGEYLPGPGTFIAESEMELAEKLSPEQRAKQLGRDRFRFVGLPGFEITQQNVKRVWNKGCSVMIRGAASHAPTMYRAILTGKPYPVKAVVTIASNPMVTQANVKLVYQALKKVDFYTVWDYWMTPSAELADYVLPVASWLERPCLSSRNGRDCVLLGGEQGLPAAMPGEYDHKTDYDILRELALRLGQREYWPWENLEQTYDHQLSPLGVTFKEFMARGGTLHPAPRYRKYEKSGFGTPTGKLELCCTTFEKLDYDPLPQYRESFENPVSRPDLAKEYPLMLITGGRFQPAFHSEHRNIDSVRRRHPNPLLQIHPDKAKELGVEEGAWVWVETPRGKTKMKATCFDGIDPRVVHAEHGWWFPELPGEEPWLHGVWESNINVLTDDAPENCDPLSGGWPLKTALCKVYKVRQF